MVYPQTRLPVVVEIAPGAAPGGDPGMWPWVDVTTSARIRDGITIGAGRGDWGKDTDPGTCSLVFNDPVGDFSQHNPLGQWYGQLGKDTPLRVRLRRGQDTFTRTVSNGWGTADSGQSWAAPTGAPSDYSVSGGSGRHAHTTVNFIRRTVLDTSLLDVEQVVDVTTPVLLTGAALVTGVLARYSNGGDDYYWLRAEFNAGGTTVQVKISRSVGGAISDLASLSAVPGLAYAANTPLRIRAEVLGSRLAIKVWAASGAEPAGWTLETTDRSIATAGQTGVQSWLVGGNTNTLPVTPTFDNYRADVDLAGGFVPAWIPTSDLSGKIRTVPVTARGTLYRLQPGQAKPPAKSPLRRTIAATGPVAYWPMEDGNNAGQAASGIAGKTPMTVTGSPNFKPVDDFQDPFDTTRFGTSALADLAAGAKLLAGSLPLAAATTAAWTVGIAAGGMDPTTHSGNVDLLEWTTPGGTYVKWRLRYLKAATRVQVLGYKADNSEWLFIERIGINVGFGPRYVSARQNGGAITIDLYELAGATPDETFSTAATLAGITSVTVNASGATSTEAMPAGHVAVWAAGAPPEVLASANDSYGVLVYGPWASWLNETAHDRLKRLCAEDGIDVDIPPVDAALAVRMGWQPVGTQLDLYRECVNADGGILYERGFALGYRTRQSLYNQTPAILLAGPSDLADVPVPDRSDQRYRNRWTVKRASGSSAVAETDGVTAGTDLPYEQSAEVNVASDDQLANIAGWNLHLSQ